MLLGELHRLNLLANAQRTMIAIYSSTALYKPARPKDKGSNMAANAVLVALLTGMFLSLRKRKRGKRLSRNNRLSLKGDLFLKRFHNNK